DEVRLFDLVPDGEVLLGWPITRFSAGATARIGVGFPIHGRAGRIPVTRAFVAAASPDSGDVAIGSAVLQGVVGAAPSDSSCIDRLRARMATFARDVMWFALFFNVEERY